MSALVLFLALSAIVAAMVAVGVVVNRDTAQITAQITAGPRVGLTESVLARATELGADAGRRAATWFVPGDWSTADLFTLRDDIDPAIVDRFTVPNLSGEWADDPTPRSLASDLGIRADSRILDAACTAWEDAASETFWEDVNSAAHDELERRRGDMLLCVDCAAFHANGTLPDCDCDYPGPHDAECPTREITAGHACTVGESEFDHTFSWSACDACGSGLGGYRHAAHSL